MSLYKNLKSSSVKYPDKVAIISNNHEVTYADFKLKVDKLSVGFRCANISSDSRVALIMHNSTEFIFTLFALEKNKNLVCLLNPNFDLREVMIKLKAVKIDVVVIENYIYEKIIEIDPNFDKNYHVILKNSNEVGKKTLLDVMNIDENYNMHDLKYNMDEKVLVQTSSGTTSSSKMAYRTRRNISVDSENIISTFNYSPQDIIYCAVPLCHGYGLTMGLIAPVKCGATIHVDKWFLVNRFFSTYFDLKPTIFIGTPETYEIMNQYKNNKIDFSYRKWFLCSSSALTEEIGINFHENFGIWINQVYGMMETSTISANLNPNEDNFLSVGKPVNSVKVRINNEANNDNKEGEILINSETISSEYIDIHGNENILDEDSWFRTRDIGIKDSANNIKIVGRAKST